MNRFTTKTKPPSRHLRSILMPVVSALFGLTVWYIASAAVGSELLLPSPLTVLRRLIILGSKGGFYISAGMSLLRILAGYIAGIAAGALSAAVCSANLTLTYLTKPIVSIIRATPVASFILLALVWISTGNIPGFISFLMVFPIIWNNVRTGIQSADHDLVEAARIYNLKPLYKIKYLYFPSALPFFVSSAVTSLGLAWKAGIAAEVLCTPRFSIGKQLYESKLYLETPDLFAWTLLVIVLSMLIERIITLLFGLFSPKKQANLQKGRPAGAADIK